MRICIPINRFLQVWYGILIVRFFVLKLGYSSMSEISDEEVDYGSSDIVGNPNIYLDYAWSKPGNYSQD